MTARKTFRIKCDAISYRKGFLEVSAKIHAGCVNIEAWEIDAETNITDVEWVDDLSIADSSVVGSTELELTVNQVRKLAAALLAAADSMDDR